MLIEWHCQYQALERTFCWTLRSWLVGQAKFVESKIFLIPLSQFGGNKKTPGPPA
jgi:hypothetical protein